VLLEGWTITQCLPCIADKTKIRIIASLSNHVEEVFPYLNAILKNIAYVPIAKTITMKKDYRLITIYPHMITIAKTDDEEDAKKTLKWLQDLINDTWDRRESITPSYERHQLLRPLDVYSLLPKKNCKLCGEMTCFAFGLKLFQGSKTLDQCPLLKEAEYSAGGERLREVMGATGIVRLDD
jgi:ArsR family metal-binding transcriptional regulator